MYRDKLGYKLKKEKYDKKCIHLVVCSSIVVLR